MHAGRYPKPTVLKQRDGAQKSKLPKKEPKPVGDLKNPPDWLSEAQCAIWAYAIANAPPGLLKKIDLSVFTTWVVAVDTHQQATEAFAKDGRALLDTKRGGYMPNPLIGVINSQAAIILRSSQHLGFSPAARPRIHYDAADAPDGGQATAESFEDFINDSPQPCGNSAEIH